MADPGKRDAWIALNLVPGLTSSGLQRLRAAFEDPRAILGAGTDELRHTGGLGPKPAARLASFAWEAPLAEEKRRAEELGVAIQTLEDVTYPAPLREIFDPPPVLYILGRLLDADRVSIAIVGTRRPTSYGRRMARKLGRELAERGVTIVSGMARGIDSAAHEGALEAGGRTVAVAGCGLSRVYPPESADLQEAIARQGAVLSERPLDDPPLARHFPQRNRIIAGFVLGVVVVEAAERSGALITARLAAEQGREVFALPGRVDSDKSRGPHRLLREGAGLVESAGDILAELPSEAAGLLRRPSTKSADGPPLSGAEATVFGLIETEEKQIDQLIRESRLSPADVSGALIALELKGLIRQYPGKVFARP